MGRTKKEIKDELEDLEDVVRVLLRNRKASWAWEQVERFVPDWREPGDPANG